MYKFKTVIGTDDQNKPKVPFSQKVLKYVKQVMWFGGPSFKEVNEQVKQAIKETDYLLKNDGTKSNFKCDNL